jgi:hypothetical protein
MSTKMNTRTTSLDTSLLPALVAASEITVLGSGPVKAAVSPVDELSNAAPHVDSDEGHLNSINGRATDDDRLDWNLPGEQA